MIIISGIYRVKAMAYKCIPNDNTQNNHFYRFQEGILNFMNQPIKIQQKSPKFLSRTLL